MTKNERATLKKYPVCLRCETTHNLVVSRIVHPNYVPEMYDVLNNMQTLCKPCDKVKGTQSTDYRDRMEDISQSNQEVKMILYKQARRDNK